MSPTDAPDTVNKAGKGVWYRFLVITSVIVLIMIAGRFYFTAHAIHEQAFVPTSGTDTSAGSSSTLTTANITALGTVDANRYTSNGNWPKNASTFDESKYIEFVFTPNIPLVALIQSVSITNVYSRSNTLTGAKLEVWDGTGWSHSHTLTIPAAVNVDASDTIDVSSYINTTAKANGIKVRFLAYRNNNGNTKTSHNFIQVRIVFQYAPTITSVDISPTSPKTNDVLTARVVSVDPDGDPLTTHYQWKKNNANVGTDAATLDLSQAGNGDKGDQITVLASVDDGHGGTASQLSASVAIVNSPPVVAPQSTSTMENTPVAINLAGTDADNDSLVYRVVTPPAHGTTTISGAVATYIPDSYFSGSDSFTFEADDGTEHSAHTLATIDVLPVNHPPVASNQSANTLEHTPVTILLPATDPDNDPLTLSVVSQPASGTLGDIFDGNKIIYTPNGHFFGTDTFVFEAKDPSMASSTATVSISVAEVNDAPVASDGTAMGNEDTPITMTFNASDPKGTPVSFEIVTGPSHGTLGPIAGNTVTYTPGENYNGTDLFLFKASDGSLYSNTAQETITINPVNDPPVLAPIHDATVDEGTLFSLIAVATDPDNASGTLRYSLGAAPAHATIDTMTGGVTWTPDESDGPGTYPITVDVSDGSLSASTSFMLTVNEANTPPVADNITVSTAENAPISFDLKASDADLPPNTLTYSIIDDPRHGTITRTLEHGITYAPFSGFEDMDSFRYLANDGIANSNIATVNISVSPGLKPSVIVTVPAGISNSTPPEAFVSAPTPAPAPAPVPSASATSPTVVSTTTPLVATTTAATGTEIVLPSGVERSWLIKALDLMRQLKELLDKIAVYLKV